MIQIVKLAAQFAVLMFGIGGWMSPFLVAAPTTVDAPVTHVLSADHPTTTLKLKSNPTTGYSWFLTAYNPEFLTLQTHQYVAPTSHLIGAPGYEIWTFKATPLALKAPMILNIEMRYARPWEPLSGTSHTFYIVTHVVADSDPS